MRKEKVGAFVFPSFFGCVRFTYFDYNVTNLILVPALPLYVDLDISQSFSSYSF